MTESGTIGQKAISEDYPIEAERTWETIQDLVPTEQDMVRERDKVGLR
jgi:hypothetical protein